MNVKRVWHRLFLEERPSVGLSLFRPFVAFTAGAHILPTFFHMQDNYLSTAFKEKNLSFFTPGVIAWVDKSPDALVTAMAVLFSVALVCFAIGLFSQISCITLTLGCYYFYALNALHIGTLSYDILLVTLFLMCVTNYHGDTFSVDAWLRKSPPRPRPFFIQRLLQIQIAFTYFYTGLIKITAHGNWLTGNPMHCLYCSVPDSVVKHFPGREFLAGNPELCYGLGLTVIVFELLSPLLLFWYRTRYAAIAIAFIFHLLLFLTLHVPTIFLFLFPPQLLLFIAPEAFIRKILRR